MRMAPTCVLLLSVVASASGEQPDQAKMVPKPLAEGPPSFSAQLEMVTVDAVVTGRGGQPISDLSKEDFLLTEDGKPQSIASFEAIDLPESPSVEPARPRAVSTNVGAAARTARAFAVLFDDVHLEPAQAQRAKEAVRQFLRRGAREGDRVLLVSASGSAWWSARMETDRDQLLAILDRLTGLRVLDGLPRERVLEYEALQIVAFHDAVVCGHVERRFRAVGLISPVEDLEGQGRLPFGMCQPFVEARAKEVYQQSLGRARTTLGTMERVLDALGTTRGRKAMILVSEGFVHNPQLDAFRNVVQAARRANVAVYFIGTRGLDMGETLFKAESDVDIDLQDLGDMRAYETRETEGPETIADSTGGFSVRNTNDPGRGITRIADDSRAYYLLGYNSTNTSRDGSFRRIEVKVNRPGLSVRARRGYFAPRATDVAEAPSETEIGTPPNLRRAIDAPFEVDDIALRLTAFVLDQTSAGRTRVLVHADIDTSKLAFEEQGGLQIDALEVYVGLICRESGERFQNSERIAMKLQPATRERLGWHPISKDFDLPVGHYQVKVAVCDRNSRRVGSVLHTLEVPTPGGLRVSTPVLTDTLRPAEGPGAKPVPLPIARRDFPVTGTLYCQIEVYGAAQDDKSGLSRVTQWYSVVRRDGVEVRRMEPRLIQPSAKKELTRLFGFALSELGPGDYDLIISVEDELSRERQELRETFLVVAAPGS